MIRKIVFILFFIILLNTEGISREFPINNEFSIGERIDCSIKASIKYNVPVDVLLAISSIENGNIDTISKNSNGTYDYGVMQINDIYIKELNEKLNLELKSEDFLQRNCFSFQVAAYKLKEHIKFDNGDLLTRLAMYHSRTPHFNNIYKKKLVSHAKYWSEFLQRHDYKLYLYVDVIN